MSLSHTNKKIMPYLDKIDTSAEHIGAVNTVIYRDGNWIGYNTDGFGFVRALEYRYPEVIEKNKYTSIAHWCGRSGKRNLCSFTNERCRTN